MPCDSATITTSGDGGGIVVDSVSILNRSPTVGNTVSVDVTLSNTATSAKDKTFNVVVNSQQVATLTASLAAGASKTKTIDVQVPNADTFTVSVGTTSDVVTTQQPGGGGDQTPGVVDQVTQFVRDHPLETAAGLGVVGLGVMMSGDDRRNYRRGGR